MWKEWAVGGVVGAVALAALMWDGTPRWLKAVVLVLGVVGPLLPVLALVPWYFVARARGLLPRRADPTSLRVEGEVLVVTYGEKTERHALADVTRARHVQNDNWTESKQLADALTLYAGRRRLTRVPLDAAGIELLSDELQRRNVTVERVLVSAPAFLD